MHRFHAAAAFAMLLLLSPAAGVTERGGYQDSQPFQLSVAVDLVVLHPTVRDRNGSFVADLGKQNFEVREDGVRQVIRLFRHEDTPVAVGLVVDHSGSMGRKLSDVISAARTFARSSNPEDRMFVINFNEKVTLGLPAAMRFTNRPEDLEAAILKARSIGQTALYDAVASGFEHLREAGREKKVLIVISDGGDNASVLDLAAILKMAAQSSALIYTIGIFDDEDPDRNPGVLRRLARATGGDAFFPHQPNEAAAICEGIARDIRNQYTLGYVPTSTAQPGSYRSVRVAASAPGRGKLVVRARAGYIAGEAGQIRNEQAK